MTDELTQGKLAKMRAVAGAGLDAPPPVVLALLDHIDALAAIVERAHREADDLARLEAEEEVNRRDADMVEDRLYYEGARDAYGNAAVWLREALNGGEGDV